MDSRRPQSFCAAVALWSELGPRWQTEDLYNHQGTKAKSSALRRGGREETPGSITETQPAVYTRQRGRQRGWGLPTCSAERQGTGHPGAGLVLVAADACTVPQLPGQLDGDFQ